MATVEEVIDRLKRNADLSQVEGMGRYGMSTEGRLGVKVPEMRRIAKEIGTDHDLALKLWQTGLAEARIVAGMVADPHSLTGEQMDAWVAQLDSWDVCDQLCMNLLEKSPFALQKIHEWSQREEEFVKRAAFALIACLAWHDKKLDDSFFTDLLPLVQEGANDERNYVKKAVSWALRHIGKRNRSLNAHAIRAAEQIAEQDTRAARWVAADVLRELTNEKIQSRLKD